MAIGTGPVSMRDVFYEIYGRYPAAGESYTLAQLVQASNLSNKGQPYDLLRFRGYTHYVFDYQQWYNYGYNAGYSDGSSQLYYDPGRHTMQQDMTMDEERAFQDGYSMGYSAGSGGIIW